jgi:hypothetical protein
MKLKAMLAKKQICARMLWFLSEKGVVPKRLPSCDQDEQQAIVMHWPFRRVGRDNNLHIHISAQNQGRKVEPTSLSIVTE